MQSSHDQCKLAQDLDDQALANLIEFGFDQHKSLIALQITNGDLEAAAQLQMGFENRVSSSSLEDLEALQQANVKIHNAETQDKSQEEVKTIENQSKEEKSEQKPKKEEDPNYMKMTIAVRRDLKMTKGKVAAQVAHAVLGLYKKASLAIPAKVLAWELNSWPKIVLQVENQKEMELIIAKAVNIGVQYCAVHDAGKTEVPAGTLTCCAFGPDGAGRVNEVTGELRLLK